MYNLMYDKKIRVLHVIDKLSVEGSKIHGVTRALSWWLPRMDRSKFEFSVCSLRSPEEAARFFENEGIEVKFLGRNKFDPLTLVDIVSIIRRKRPDILHLHGYGSTNFGRIAGMITGTPKIVHEHTVIEDQPVYQTFADKILSPLNDIAIAVSPTVKKFMVNRRKVDREKIKCIFNGIPLEDFYPSGEENIESKRKSLGIRQEQPVVCCVGRLDTQKGQRYLISAADKVTNDIPEAVFLIVGDGPDLDKLKRQRERLGLEDTILFTGHRDDVPDLFAMSDVVAIPSLWEGGPITLFEAMTIGKPVVGTPVGLMPDVIDDGRTGYLVPPEEVNPLASRLAQLLRNPSEAREMGESAREEVQEYDMSNAVRSLSNVYEKVLQKNAKV